MRRWAHTLARLVGERGSSARFLISRAASLQLNKAGMDVGIGGYYEPESQCFSRHFRSCSLAR